ncbi:hypothetical protein NDU88_005546 [Pleurodeles waltl]|uniref:Uncharacterized protein n=1 Tax=Pleurodeles waltl TaxID=8319 RepID=A0AAV7NN34_PLEWA|nr:hypothetical protein NDU88_005546 [Pleurodeles waltl]
MAVIIAPSCKLPVTPSRAPQIQVQVHKWEQLPSALQLPEERVSLPTVASCTTAISTVRTSSEDVATIAEQSQRPDLLSPIALSEYCDPFEPNPDIEDLEDLDLRSSAILAQSAQRHEEAEAELAEVTEAVPLTSATGGQ